ncbi:MAG: hypothetical protein HN348_10760, partial [Proteobacteria bacterium]|nr:hypothetical protein [Pseudomonadota bacterium]
MNWLTAILLSTIAFGQSVQTDRPNVPSAGIAAEGGPGTMWVNPANVAFDRDPRFGVFVSRNQGESPTSIAGVFGAEGLSLGIHNARNPDGSSDWSIDYSTSVVLPKRVSIGFLMSWKLIEGGSNFVSYDAGLSWRPLPWLGLSGVTHNIGSPDPRLKALPSTGGGLALRPFGRLAIVGVDYLHQFDISDRLRDGLPDDFVTEPALDIVNTTARVRPIRGLYLRGNLATLIDEDGPSIHNFGGGLELYFAGTGIGAHVASDTTIGGLTTWFGTDEPGESLIVPRRQIATLKVAESPEYQPRSGLFLPPAGLSYLETLEMLRRLEKERGTRGLVITLGASSMSWAQYREIRTRIQALGKAEKKVVAYLYGRPSNGAYYVASAADDILIHPATDLGLTGLNSEMTHFGGTLDIVGLEPQFVKRSEYKSAPEQVTNTKASPAALE